MDHIGTSPRIDENVGLLNRVRPDALHRMRAEYPAYKHLFKVGQTLGGIPATVLLLAAHRSLAEVIPWGDESIDLCRRRLSAARRLELGGALVATVGSAGCTVFASLGENPRTIFTAVLALAGNVCVALGSYYRGSLFTGKPGLEGSYHTFFKRCPSCDTVNV